MAFPEKSKFPILFTTDRNGRERLWACWVKDNCVFRTDGLVSGKLKDPQKHEYAGNSVKSANEQAESEAEKLWIKKCDIGYKPKADGMKIYDFVRKQKEENGGMNRGVRMFTKTAITTKTTAGKKDLDKRHCPMLAKKYKNDDDSISSVGKQLKFPAIVQAKVDGIRSISWVNKGSVILESRNGKSFVFLDHIREEIKKLFSACGEEVILDGELYVHSLFKTAKGLTKRKTSKELKNVDRFQFLSEACKITRNEPHKQEELVEYWIFDIWDIEKTNKERWQKLTGIFESYSGSILKLVPTKIVKNHDEIEKEMSRLIGEKTGRNGYEFEGAMIRQLDKLYETKNNYHSSNILKYKRFDDEEWTIEKADKCVGGVQDGAVKWHCKKTVDGKVLRVIAKQTGDVGMSKKMYKDYLKSSKKFIGKQINIRFNGRTKDGVPRFPRATSFVEDKN